MQRPLLSIALAICSVAPQFAAAQPVAASTDRIKAALEGPTRLTDGTVGFAIQRLGSGPLLTLNADQTFPMASTFKIAVAGAVLERVDRRALTLSTMVPVEPGVVVASDGIAQYLPHKGISLSIHNLLELMLTRSDNTATDVLVAQAGGPAAVTAWLRKVGVRSGQRVDADTARLIFRALDITPTGGTFRENIDRAFAADPSKRERDEKRLPNPIFNADPRDASTPVSMVQLLQLIYAGKALTRSSTDTLIAIMERCRTGDKRLKGLLPAGTPVAHKTGSLMSIANDVGVVSLPNGDKFAIAVFVKGDTRGLETQERVIAEIGRTAYDYYAAGGV
jgi:beta-lactamase class A